MIIIIELTLVGVNVGKLIMVKLHFKKSTKVLTQKQRKLNLNFFNLILRRRKINFSKPTLNYSS
jgi:hypothetical protein